MANGSDCAPGQSGRCRPAPRAQALDALRQLMKACPYCRPGRALGFLE
ncbi:DUF6233 domain-containing protein [Streptomyces griseorubiginosus]|nr:DUF6233 domain-containing protein [Streptomyces griseorubiginosus]